MATATLARKARTLLAQAQTAGAPDSPLLPERPPDPAASLAEAALAEALPLAQVMRASFARRVRDYMRSCQVSLQEALAAVDRPLSPAEQEYILHKEDPFSVSWRELERLADRDPGLALQKWEEVKQAAREEVRSGHRAAEALGGSAAERA